MNWRPSRGFAGVLALFLLLPQESRGWSGQVHALVNRAATADLPPQFSGFAHWADSLAALASAADARRGRDPNEAMRHYIDIDAYEEFFTGTLPHDYATMVERFGRQRVEDNGIIPWAIETTLATLSQQFRARDWPQAVATAADLGHYVADAHQPLHLTLNYDGQQTGQRGIHSRYESALTELHLQDLVPAPRVATAYARPVDAVFAWIDATYADVQVVLDADFAAQAAAGGQTGTPAYYDVMWSRTGALAVREVRDATHALAALWLTAWLDAGSPPLPGGGSSYVPPPAVALQLLPSVPNPFNPRTLLRFEVAEPGAASLRVLDASGRVVRTLLASDPGRGPRSLDWDGRDDAGRSVASGSYRVRLDQRGRAVERRVVLIR